MPEQPPHQLPKQAPAEGLPPGTQFPSPESPIRVECPEGHTVLIKARYAGRRGKCPVCKGPIDVPGQRSQLQTVVDADAPFVSETLDWSPQTQASATNAEESTIAPLTVGTIGRFELQHVLGRGGFGTVYLAYDRQLKRDVALKVPRHGVINTPAEREKFLREARAAAHLRHANIVPVYEAGVDGTTHYIAMGYIKGTTIKDRIDGGWRPTPQEAARIIVKIAAALHSAHLSGVIHRDVKPANVLLDARNEPFLTDFGLARREHAEVLNTIEGTVLGTPAYMSPEQASGQGHIADARTDLWSVGVMFYELLVGRRPFQGNVTELLKAIHEQEPPPPRSIVPSLTRDLETIALTCLAKHPERRYASCQHLVEELQRWERGEPILARQVTRMERGLKWARRNPALAMLSGASLVVTALLLVSLALTNIRLTDQQAKLTESLAHATKQTRLANENAARWQASEMKLSNAIGEIGITSADKAKAIKELQTAAQDSAANAERAQQLTRERDQAASDRRALIATNLQLTEDLAKASKLLQEGTTAELTEQLMATGSAEAYRFAIGHAEFYLQSGNRELAAMFLAAAPQKHRDWEWRHLFALIHQPSKVVVTWSSTSSSSRIPPYYARLLLQHHYSFSSDGKHLVLLCERPPADGNSLPYSEAVWYYINSTTSGLSTIDYSPQGYEEQYQGIGSVFFTKNGLYLVNLMPPWRSFYANSCVFDHNRKLTINLTQPSAAAFRRRPLYVFTGTTGTLHTVELSQEGQLIFSETVKESVLATRTLPVDVSRSDLTIFDVNRDGRTVLLSSHKSDNNHWFKPPPTNLWLLRANNDSIYDGILLSSDSLIRYAGVHATWAYAVDDDRLRVWDAITGKEEKDLSVHTNWLGLAGCPLISASGKRVLVRNSLCDVISGEALVKFPVTDSILGFSPKNEYLFRIVSRERKGQQALAIEAIVPALESVEAGNGTPAAMPKVQVE